MNHYAAQIVITLCGLVLSGAAFGQVSKWIDENGQVNYGSQPPKTVTATLVDSNLNVVQGGSTLNILSLYTTQSCGYCKRAKAYLNRNNIDFRELDIETSAVARAEFNNFGGGGVPLLVDDIRKLRGFQPSQYDAFLKQ